MTIAIITLILSFAVGLFVGYFWGWSVASSYAIEGKGRDR